MPHRRSWLRMLCTALLAAVPGVAVTIEDFKKKDLNAQANIVTSSVSMMMFYEASQENQAKARCINEWYFKSSTVNGERIAPPGPADMVRLIGEYETKDPTYHVEELILFRIGQVCGATSGQ